MIPVDPPIRTAVFAYGAAPGMELIPYFFALLAWIGMALAGMLLWPFMSLIRRIRGRKVVPPAAGEPAAPTEAAPTAQEGAAAE